MPNYSLYSENVAFLMSMCEGMPFWYNQVWACDVSSFPKVSQCFSLMFLITPDEEPIFTVIVVAEQSDKGMDYVNFYFWHIYIDVKTSSPVSGLIKIIEVHACTNTFCC